MNLDLYDMQMGDSGAAALDIQHRLAKLGYELGKNGADGVFSEDTAEALRLFKLDYRLEGDALIDEKTWSTLVDATFELGERTLYLRIPFFHGEDVRRLQKILNTMGFNCGYADGIFGESTQKALANFQINSAMEPDGIAADSTFKAIRRLRNAWIDRI